MTLLVEQYTGLLWNIIENDLSNPEDIKECVNDTFTEFYFQREKFDPERGTLAGYLADIARKRAISRYRKNKKHDTVPLPENQEASDGSLSGVEERLDLEKVISELNPDDLNVIRMKYYDGMMVQEIADSLKLPYEAVKKRHQRSLGKLKRMLLLALTLLLAAILTACAIKVLRYFGLVPGYGVNTDEKQAVYVLEEKIRGENETGFVELEDAVYLNGKIIVTIRIPQLEEKKFVYGIDYRLQWENQVFPLKRGISSDRYVGGQTQISEPNGTYRVLEFDAASMPPDVRDQLEMSIFVQGKESVSGENIPLSEGLGLSFHLVRADEEPLERYACSLTEEGGLLVIPRLENGELKAEIYPVNTGDYEINPALIRCIYESYLEETRVTAISPDGKVLEGSCIGYSPFSTQEFFEWNFGPAEPGEYVLHVPFVYQNAMVPSFSFLIDLKNNTWDQEAYQVPGGTVSLKRVTALGPQIKERKITSEDSRMEEEECAVLTWEIELDYENKEEGRTIIGVPLSMEQIQGSPEKSWDKSLITTFGQHTDQSMLYEYTIPEDAFEVYWKGKLTTERSAKRDDLAGQIVYRWDHSFDIPFTVK